MKKTLSYLTAMLFCFAALAQNPNYQWGFALSNTNCMASNRAITRDGSGNCIVAGTVYTNTSPLDFDPGTGSANITTNTWVDLYVAKYDAASNFQWVFQLTNNPNTGNVVPTCITTDANDNIFVAGTLYGSAVDFDPGTGTAFLTPISNADMFIAKYDANGNYQWAFLVNKVGSVTFYPYDIAADASGNCYVTGSFELTNVDFDPGLGTALLSSAGNDDEFVAKYDANGNYVWAFRVGSSSRNHGRGIALDNAANVYVTGYFIGTVDFDPSPTATFNLIGAGTPRDMFVAKYTSAGTFVWAFRVGGTNLDDEGHAIAVDKNTGDVYVTGMNEGAGNVDFDPSGATANVAGFGGYGDVFIAKYTTAGNYAWAKRIGGTSEDWGQDIEVDNYGNAYVTGRYISPTVDLDPTTGTNIVTFGSGGWDDYFITMYNSLGNYRWGFPLSSSLLEVAYVAPIGNGAFYLGGRFGNANIDFDPTTSVVNLAPTGTAPYFYLVKYQDMTVGMEKNNFEQSIHIYPNPSTGKFILDSKFTEGQLEIYDVLGSRIYSSEINNSKTEIDLSDKANGIYFVRIVSEGETYSGKIIKE